MPRFSANLSTLFREHAPPDRPRAAAEAGFRCIEMQFPYDLDRGSFAAAVRDHGLAVSVINLPAGTFMTGGAGDAAVPGREGDFRAAVEAALPWAAALKTENVNVLAGAPAPEHGRDACLETLAENLRHAAAAFADIGVRVVVEAINDTDRPGFLLPRAEDALAVIDRAGHPNLSLQLDLYHAAMTGEDPAESVARHISRTGHIQFADAPGRHEPGTGAIDFDAAFAAIDAAGYAGWVAAEYFPAGRTEDGLGWLARDG